MKLELAPNRRRQDFFAFAVIFLALVLRSSFFGFEYYYQLDDYIHFRALPEGTDIIQLCIEGGYFSSRPLAIWSDFAIWSPMNHYLAVVVICAMYAGAAVIYWSIFRRHFGTGWFFVIFFTLLPLGFEGTYWLAASTRVVPPMLFSAAALWCLDRFVEKKQYGLLPLYVLLSFGSFLLYEQLLVLSLALSLMLMLLHLMKKRWHSLWALLIFLAVGAYVAFTGHFTVADSSLGSRMELILPWQEGYFTQFLPSLLNQVRKSFLEGGWSTLSKGFVRGLEIIFSRTTDPLEKAPVLAVLIPVLIPLILYVGRKSETAQEGTSKFWTPAFGFLAALAPLTPFFIIASPWFSLRNTVPSFLGLALLLDWLLRKLTKNRTAALSAVFAAICLVASVSELHDYRMTTVYNEQVTSAVSQAEQAYELSGTVGILGLNESHLADQNYLYHDHVLGSHGSDWALAGMVRYYTGSAPGCAFVPLSTDGEYYFSVWSEQTKDVNRFDQLLLYDHETGTMELLTRESREGETLLYDETGTLRGRVWKAETGHGMIEFYPVSAD